MNMQLGNMQAMFNDAAATPDTPVVTGDRDTDRALGRGYADQIVSYMRLTGNRGYFQFACAAMVEVGGPMKRAFFLRIAELVT